jgi:NAD(P)-dependent dehydrogenase (short-subunit alcohol dehydrogenase family)
MRRVADSTEVAQVALFLASPASSYLTGQLVAVDGGFMVS